MRNYLLFLVASLWTICAGFAQDERRNEMEAINPPIESDNEFLGERISFEALPLAGQPALRGNGTGKYILTKTDTGEEIGRYDVYNDPSGGPSVNTVLNSLPDGAYTVTLTEDDLDMRGGGFRYGQKVTIKSGPGGPYQIVNTRVSTTTNTQYHFSQVSGDLILENIIFDGGGVGGGINMMSGEQHNPDKKPNLLIKEGTIIQNCKDSINIGAAVRTTGPNVTMIMDGGSIINNSTERSGGGIHVGSGNTFIMNGGVIKGNKASQDGGGVMVNDGGHFIMNGGEISDNTAKRYGGGVCVGVGTGGSSIETNGGDILNNTAGFGGGIYIDIRGGSFVLKDLTISGNKAEAGSGGGIMSYSQLDLSNSFFKNNTATKYGGGIAVWAPSNIEKTEFESNQADEGGGFWLRHFYPSGWESMETKIANSTFAKNKATFGGGIEIFNGQTLIEGANIVANESTKSGAGLFTNSKTTIKKSNIRENKAATVGGGIDSRTSIEIDNTEIVENTSLQGGGLYLRNSNSEESFINNSVVKGNGADYGGGALLQTGVLNVKNTSFIQNKVTEGGGAIFTFYAEYANPVDVTKYQNIKLESSTVFEGNTAGGGLFNPPTNADILTNIAFTRTSLTGTGKIIPDHPLNNYDINYKYDSYEITYLPNEGSGSFTDAAVKDGEYEFKSVNATGITRPGYTFTGWNTTADGSGAKYEVGGKLVVTADLTVYAQWKLTEEPVTPPTVYYTVDLIAPYLSCYTYIPGDGMQEVEEGSCFTFEINYEYCCFPRCEFEVYSYPGMEPIAPKDSSSMKITYELCHIFENKVIEIKPICDCDDVSNEVLDVKERIWTGAGKIFIENLSPDVVRIYNINGQAVYEEKLPQGQHAIPVAKGLYIVRLGDYREGVKVVVSDF